MQSTASTQVVYQACCHGKITIGGYSNCFDSLTVNDRGQLDDDEQTRVPHRTIL